MRFGGDRRRFYHKGSDEQAMDMQHFVMSAVIFVQVIPGCKIQMANTLPRAIFIEKVQVMTNKLFEPLNLGVFFKQALPRRAQHLGDAVAKHSKQIQEQRCVVRSVCWIQFLLADTCRK